LAARNGSQDHPQALTVRDMDARPTYWLILRRSEAPLYFFKEACLRKLA